MNHTREQELIGRLIDISRAYHDKAHNSEHGTFTGSTYGPLKPFESCPNPSCVRTHLVIAGKPSEDRCGAWGGCELPRGHNMGRVDIPENHGSQSSQ